MAMIDPESYQHFRASIKAHKRTLLEADWKAQSLENGFPIMQTQEVQDVLKQVDDAAESFYTDDFVPTGNYCHNPECDSCQDEMKAERGAYEREQAVAAFFRDFDLLHSDSDPDPIVLACREIELGITKAEWDEHRAQKAAEDAEVKF